MDTLACIWITHALSRPLLVARSCAYHPLVQEKVQNAPSLGLIPQENFVSDFVLAELEPFTSKHGGFLSVERVEFVANRGNVIIKYQHPDFKDSDKTLAFVGSHMDVVPANPEGWARDPFSLTVEGDKLYGRGTTDCLGHVALMTRTCLVLSSWSEDNAWGR